MFFLRNLGFVLVVFRLENAEVRTGLGHEVHVHVSPLETRGIFGGSNCLEVDSEPVEKLSAEMSVGHFTTPEHDRDLHPVALGKEAFDMSRLEIIVMPVNLGTHLDLFNSDNFLVFLGNLALLGQFVFMLSIVENPTDRRCGVGCDLDEIEIPVLGGLNGLIELKDSQLLPLGINYPDFPGPDLPVDPRTGALNWSMTELS